MKVYADTSVFGGVYDEEFAEPSKAFFSEVDAGKFKLFVSAIVQAEIASAPQQVQDFFQCMLATAEIIELTQEVLNLRNAYLDAGIITPKSIDDAAHVALATISGCDMIVSWNFKHIVHFQKIPKYNAVNTLNSYHSINIFSPLEVIEYDDS
ncbi:MAG TPA: type II toxin-antitoxin system VapC family toxin [Candidatus Competibacteraceae bacterium]|nr:type II toxin-antitoxin system VapC family toxin [Candidatus Competibacteraceae bacterium]MCB1780811.1 type II toxin-antitoxin system VapC family toxin [Candidatus Competibacteraceae bacterium]HRY18746.1 type II toxin-antitoxin system VapC family toxin [Candidatus Competibacteraceae bacterium]